MAFFHSLVRGQSVIWARNFSLGYCDLQFYAIMNAFFCINEWLLFQCGLKECFPILL